MYEHDAYEISQTICILCETIVSSFGDSALILPGPEGPLLSTATTPHDQGSALHKGCLEDIQKTFRRRKKFDLTRRLWLLQHTKSHLWPLRQLAGRSVSELVRTSETTTEFGCYLKGLPKEILEHIGEYSHQSALTGLAILRQSGLFMSTCKVDENRSRIISLSGRISVSFRRLFQHTYVAEVAPVKASPNAAIGFLLCTDGIACRDIKLAGSTRQRKDRWYRHVLATCDDNLLLVYKVRPCQLENI